MNPSKWECVYYFTFLTVIIKTYTVDTPYENVLGTE